MLKMPQTDIGNTTASDLNSAMTDYSVDPDTTDGATGDKETTWINTDWDTWLGQYKTTPELRGVIDAKSTWTIGKGFKADVETTVILNEMRGFGKDTFNTILENAMRTMQIGGDAFCEIIRDEEGELINLKPLDPSSIKIYVDKKGLIKKYAQVSKVAGKKGETPFEPEEIFHLPRNRRADEIHGVSMVQALIDIILMKNEAMTDYKKVLHRNVRPMMIFHLDTDDTTKIADFKAKRDAAKEDTEDMYVPKDAVVPEQISIGSNATLNPLPWIQYLDNMFYEVAGVPKIILGGSGEFTEASAKIAYLAFQQTIEEEQLFIEEQVLNQLGFSIKLNFPVSLENDLLSDNKKDGAVNIDPNETTQGGEMANENETETG